MERYDPFSNTWESVEPLLEAVSSAAVVPCAGRLYVIGGARQDNISTDKVGVDRILEAWYVLALSWHFPVPIHFLI